MRLGWIQTSEDLIAGLVAAGYVNSGGSLNHISSHIVRHSMTDGTLEAHIQHLRNSYRSRAEAMGFQHGEVFSISRRLNHCLRLSFAQYNEEDIREGIARMRPLFD